MAETQSEYCHAKDLSEANKHPSKSISFQSLCSVQLDSHKLALAEFNFTIMDGGCSHTPKINLHCSDMQIMMEMREHPPNVLTGTDDNFAESGVHRL